MSQIKIVPDERTLATQAATYFARLASRTIQERGHFRVALAGGSTPKRMYSLITRTPLTGQVDWSKVYFFWGDERCVPPDHSESNYHMANEALLSRVPVPTANVNRIPGELSARIAAQIYEEELRRVFGEGAPRFDLVLLGLGSDGHTASLFPGSTLVMESNCLVAAVPHHTPPPPLVDRVTLTPHVLNAARHIVFLVSGEDKAEILAQVLQGPYQPERYPAQVIRPTDGELLWLLDEQSAVKITRYT